MHSVFFDGELRGSELIGFAKTAFARLFLKYFSNGGDAQPDKVRLAEPIVG